MNRAKRGFTLVEILIVVIILGILAAIVIPQFTEASNDARESSLASDLQTARSQVELYKVQHNMYPGYIRNVDGSLTAWDGALFVTQLTTQTDADGNAGTDYGPYLQSFPKNPFENDDGQEDLVTGGAAACPGDGLSGWYFNTDIGRISPNDPDHNDL